MAQQLRHFLAIIAQGGDGELIIDRSDKPFIDLSVARMAAARFTVFLHENGLKHLRFTVIVDPATPLSEIGSGDKIG